MERPDAFSENGRPHSDPRSLRPSFFVPQVCIPDSSQFFPRHRRQAHAIEEDCDIDAGGPRPCRNLHAAPCQDGGRGPRAMPRRAPSLRGPRALGRRRPRLRPYGRAGRDRGARHQDRRCDGHVHGLHGWRRLCGGLFGRRNPRHRARRRLGSHDGAPRRPRGAALAPQGGRLQESGRLGHRVRQGRPREAPRQRHPVRGARPLPQ